SKQLKQIRSLRKCEQLKVLHEIKNDPSAMLNHVIPAFAQLNDNDFNSAIKQICESREINTQIQRKRNDMIIQICNLPDQQVLNASTLFQTMTYPRGIHKGEIISTHLQKKALKFVDSGIYKHHYTINALESRFKFLKKEIRRLENNRSSLNTKVHSLSMQLVKAKQSKKKQISKIRVAIQKAKQIKPNQFRNAASKLFKINHKEYSAKFVKLATDISTIGHTSIRATVECTKAVFQFLTGESPQQWIAPSTLARWNKEVAALSFSQNCPKENSSRFFGYGIMVDESTRGEKKVLIICFSHWNNIKEEPVITVAKLTDLTHCNAKTVSATVFETCQHKNQKVTLPPGNRAHEMPDKMLIWIKDLQNCLDNIYELFGEELADAKHELNTTDFENFCELLHNGVENALNGFIKWMETWVHLPLCICRLGGENGPEFARAFLKVFFSWNSSKEQSITECSYIENLRMDLSSERITTFGLLEELNHLDFFEEFKAFANSDIAEPEKFPLVYEFLKFQSRIQLSGLDGGIQEISQNDLRNIRQKCQKFSI
ncbi:38938_t:CDS:2, partial [Gigaspora margarita]